MTPLAEFTDYESLRRALREVREQRDISFTLLNEITGAPDGYFDRVLGPSAPKRMSINSLTCLLGGLGIKAVFFDDPEALARIKNRLEPRDRPHLVSARSRWRTYAWRRTRNRYALSGARTSRCSARS